LSQFLHCAAQAWGVDVACGPRMERDRIEDQSTRVFENRVGRPERK